MEKIISHKTFWKILHILNMVSHEPEQSINVCFLSLPALRQCQEKIMINPIRTVKSLCHFCTLSLLWWMNSYEDKCSYATQLHSLLHPATHTQVLMQVQPSSFRAVQEIATQRFPQQCFQSAPQKEEIKVCSE